MWRLTAISPITIHTFFLHVVFPPPHFPIFSVKIACRTKTSVTLYNYFGQTNYR